MKSRSELTGEVLRQTGRNVSSVALALLVLVTAAGGSLNAQGAAQGHGGAQTQPADQASKRATAKSRNETTFRRLGYQHAGQFPINFPVPPYPNNVVTTDFLSSTKGNLSASATIFTTDPPASVFNFYLAACNKANFKVKSHKPKDTDKPGKAFYLLNARNDKQELNIVCFQSRKRPGTIVTLSLSLHK